VRAATTLFHASSISRAFRFDSAANADAANFSTLGGTACSRVRRPRARRVASPLASPLVVARGIASPRGIASASLASLCRRRRRVGIRRRAFESVRTRSRTHRAPNERDASATLVRARRRASRRARRSRRSRARAFGRCFD